MYTCSPILSSPFFRRVSVVHHGGASVDRNTGRTVSHGGGTRGRHVRHGVRHLVPFVVRVGRFRWCVVVGHVGMGHGALLPPSARRCRCRSTTGPPTRGRPGVRRRQRQRRARRRAHVHVAFVRHFRSPPCIRVLYLPRNPRRTVVVAVSPRLPSCVHCPVVCPQTNVSPVRCRPVVHGGVGGTPKTTN